MSEHLTDTNVGNIGYIKKQKAIDILKQRKREPWYLHKDLDWDNGVAEAISDIEYIEPDNVVPYSIELDGTLTVTVPKGIKRIDRILIEEDGTQYGGLFYPDTGGCFLSSMEKE